MKKRILFLLFLVFATSFLGAGAQTVIKIPVDFLNEIAKTTEFKTDISFVKRLLIKQIIKNSSIKGVKLKDFKIDTLVEYFNEDNLFKVLPSHKLVEPITGATLEFNTDGKCNNDSCSITIDLNGDKGPNELWINSDDPKDRINVILKKGEDGEINLVFPY